LIRRKESIPSKGKQSRAAKREEKKNKERNSRDFVEVEEKNRVSQSSAEEGEEKE